MRETIVYSSIYHIDGAVVTFDADTVFVSAGELFSYSKEGLVESTTILEPIEFDIVKDNIFPTVYDLYITRDELGKYNYHLDRCAMSENNFAFYRGDKQLLHSYLNIMVLPHQDLQSAEMFEVRYLKLEEVTEDVEDTTTYQQ